MICVAFVLCALCVTTARKVPDSRDHKITGIVDLCVIHPSWKVDVQLMHCDHARHFRVPVWPQLGKFRVQWAVLGGHRIPRVCVVCANAIGFL